jgi:hypothetical protein
LIPNIVQSCQLSLRCDNINGHFTGGPTRVSVSISVGLSGLRMRRTLESLFFTCEVTTAFWSHKHLRMNLYFESLKFRVSRTKTLRDDQIFYFNCIIRQSCQWMKSYSFVGRVWGTDGMILTGGGG